MAIITGSAIGIGLGVKKLLAALSAAKAAKLLAAGAKVGGRAALGAVKKLPAAVKRAGYQGPLDVGMNIAPELFFGAQAAMYQPGDVVDKGLAFGTQLALGSVGAGGFRSLANTGRMARRAKAATDRAESLLMRAARDGKKANMGRIEELRRIGANQGRMAGMVSQGIEMGGVGLGATFGYPVTEGLLRTKDRMMGGEGLSPTDKLILEEQLLQEEQIRQAYLAGQQGYDPYTGDVPMDGYYYG